MSQPKLGELYKAKVAGVKDASHVAVITAKARGVLNPGQKVYIFKGDWPTEYMITDDLPECGATGVVDPFLKSPVKAGEYCCVLVLKFSDLRHTWECEDIEKPAYQQVEADPDYGFDEDGWGYDECRHCD